MYYSNESKDLKNDIYFEEFNYQNYILQSWYRKTNNKKKIQYCMILDKNDKILYCVKSIAAAKKWCRSPVMEVAI